MPKTLIKLLEPLEEELTGKGLKKSGLIITVSGLSGSGKSTVVKMLMEAFPELRLVYSGGIFRENAKKLGMSVEEYCQRRVREDDIETDREVLRRSFGGGVIVDSRLAGWSLGSRADFRVFVTCPFVTRAERLSKRDGTTPRDAGEGLRKRDGSDSDRYRELYGIDINDLSVYDFIIDNSGPLDELETGVRKVAERVRPLLRGR